MLVRFWGTRGSLPVAPTADIIQKKIARALVAADGRRFANADEAERFVEADLSFAAGATYGGATPCVELEAGDGSYVICDMGSGLRPSGSIPSAAMPPATPRPTTSFCPICTGTTSWAFRSSRPPSIRTSPSASMPLTPMPSRRCAASRRKSPSRCRSTGCGPKFEFVQLTPGEPYSGRRRAGGNQAPAPFPRQLRLSFHRAATSGS